MLVVANSPRPTPGPVIKILVYRLPYTELSKLEIARRHVTDLDRFKYRKKPPPDITKLGTE